MEVDITKVIDVGILGVIFWLVVVGRYIRLEREVKERDRRIAEIAEERDRWRDAALTGTKVAEYLVSKKPPT